MKRTHAWITIMAIFIAVVYSPALNSQETKEATDIAEISFEDLLNTEITVAGKKAQSISESAAIISVFTQEDIQRLGIINLADLFSYVPGFTVTDNYWNREIITARELFQALYNDKILMLINGVPAYEAINTEYYLDLLPTEAINRIEIIRGPGSTLYGTNAFAGVINIITQKGSEFNKLSLKGSAGAFGLFEQTATFGKKTGELDILFSGSIRADSGYTHLIPYSEARETNLQQNYRKAFTRGHLGIGWKDFSLSMQFLDIEYEHFGMVPIAWAQGTAKHSNYNITLQYGTQVSAKLSTTNMVRMMRQVRENEAGVFLATLPRADGKSATAPSFIDWDGNVFQFESQWNLTLSNQFSMVGGATIEKRDPYHITTMFDEWGLQPETRLIGGEGSYTFPPEQNILDYGTYLQGDYRSGRIGLVGGIRYSYMGTAEKSFLAPRAALIVNLAKGLNLKALYGMAFRSPTIYETEVFVKNVLYGGQKEVKPEKVSTIELGLDYVSKKWSARANYYAMWVDDIIGRRGLTPEDVIRLNAGGGVIYDNIANQQLSGIEAEIRFIPSESFSCFVNASVRGGKNADNKQDIDYLAKVLMSGGFTFKLPGINMDFSPNFYYVGKRDGLALNGNRYHFSDYLIVNLRTAFHVSPRLKLNLIWKNLSNQTYYYPEMTRNKIGVQLPGNTPSALFMQIDYAFDI